MCFKRSQSGYPSLLIVNDLSEGLLMEMKNNEITAERNLGRVVLTVGVFDLLHYGHFELFRRARELAGDNGKLIVAVQEDGVVTKYKPGAKLVYDWNKRVKMISALRYVDKVVPYGDIDESIKQIDFDIFAIGGDQNHAGFQRAVKWCQENGKRVVRVSRTNGISSSDIRKGAALK